MVLFSNIKSKFGKQVSKIFKPTVPPHLQCKCHPVEAFNRSNLTVLAELQSNLDFQKNTIYHEHRFTKPRYSTSSILQSLRFICMLINKTHLSNQHVEVVKLLLDTEFLMTELEALSYFTHKVTLPFLLLLRLTLNKTSKYFLSCMKILAIEYGHYGCLCGTLSTS